MSELEPSESDQLDEALASLRREIQTRFGAPRAERAPSVDWQALYTQVRRWASSFGMSERSGEVDEFGLDAAALANAAPLLEFLYERWWRVDLQGLENLPAHGPGLLVANHSGLLPYDGLMLAHGVERGHESAERECLPNRSRDRKVSDRTSARRPREPQQ